MALRYRLTQQKVPRSLGEKWLLIADCLDALEADYRDIYPDEPSPFSEGFKESLRKLIIPR